MSTIHHITPPPSADDDTDPAPLTPEEAARATNSAATFSEEHIALEFAKAHADNLRYVEKWGRWLMWNGKLWAPDQTPYIKNLIRVLCRQTSLQAAHNTRTRPLARGIASLRTEAAVEKISRVDPRIDATTEQWDANPWLLNTPGGSVDLHTGKLRASRREDYSAKIIAAVPAIRSDCPRWLKFLDRIMAGNQELIDFLQRIAGYSLTGITSEDALFFFHGTGANGKSTLVNTWRGIMAGYATTAATEIFMASNIDQHPTGVAGLRGARLVCATETEEGRAWAESRIKNLTGHDPIEARFMRQDFFEFLPQFKLLISGNHRPSLRNVDPAIRRRFNLIPFAVEIAEEERDKDLGDKLQKEWPAILRWMIEGCLAWQREGLNAPKAVRDATESYLAAEDALALWIAECCETGRTDDYTATTTDLYASWKAWADAASEAVGNTKSFVHRLVDRKFKPWADPITRRHGFSGIRLHVVKADEEKKP
jgi:putative DNA primase/helicase